MIKCIVFDLDGTLVDTLKDLGCTANEALNSFGYQEIEIDEYRYFVGNGIKKLVERALIRACGDISLFNDVYYKFLDIYNENYLKHSSIYEGIFELLDFLKENNYLLFVNTNKNNTIANEMIEKLFPGYFLGVYGDSKDYPRKPDPYILNKIKNEYNLNDDEILLVGDSDVDVYTAHNSNIKAIGCSYGFRKEEELIKAGCDYLVSQPLEIVDLLTKINCKNI